MKYMGSKRRLAKYILPIILSNRQTNQLYVEPFVGGGNMIEQVTGRRLGTDANVYVIAALKQIRDDLSVLPKDNNDANELDHKRIKLSGSNWERGYYGFALSYGGKYFNSWRKDKVGKRDYVAESYRAAVKQHKLLKDVDLAVCKYNDLVLNEPSIIYCDPPYQGTGGVAGYRTEFNSDEFWEWCRTQSRLGHQVYVSEYNAPDDFECLYEREQVSNLTKDISCKPSIEKLWKIKE